MQVNKYGSKTCTCLSKHWHQSRFEADVCNSLLGELQAKRIKKFSVQYKIELKMNGVHITNHYVDFLVEKKDGSLVFVEAKGVETEAWRIKRRLCEILCPAIEYKVVRYGKGVSFGR